MVAMKCVAVLVFPGAVKNGDTAFELAHGMNIYDFMNKIYTPEYGRVKATTENLVQEVGLRQRRCEFAHDYDRAAQLAAKRFHLVPLG